MGDGRRVETRYLASTSRFGGDSSGPAINNHRQVALFEFLDEEGQGIFVSNRDGSIVTIAHSSGPVDFPGDVSIIKDGLVAFDATLDTFEQAILVGDGNSLRTVADTAGPFSDFGFGGPSLNDDGQVAFSASLDTGEQGLFIGPGPVANRVIGTGDALDGSVVTNVVFCREGLNNRGELAFQAQLEDGRTVIVRAEPSRR